MNIGLLQPRTLDLDRSATIPALLRRSLERTPDSCAVAMIGETLSYAELDARTSNLAAALVAAGAGKGTRIALLAPDGIFWVTAFLAAARIGALVVAVSTLATAPELAHIIRHSDAQMLIGVRRFLRNDYALRLETAFSELKQHAGGPLYLNEAPFLRSIWLDDASALEWASSHAALVNCHAPHPGLIAAMEGEVVPSDDAVIIYTSGSSSLPKAVVHTHRAVAQHSLVLADYFRIVPADRLMPLLPAFWIGGLNMLFQLLGSGATVVYPWSPAPEDVVAAVTQLGVTRINSWGPQTEKIRIAISAAGIDPGTIGGLGPWRTPEGDAIPPGHTANMLGMTETFGPHSAELIGELLPPDRRGASGRATSDYERRIVDTVTGDILGSGQSGELQVRRGGLMRGFYKMDPDRVFTPDGFYPTGDTARLDADGYLFFEGRRTDMIKTGGANVSRLEVEAALHLLPGVALSIVLPLPDASAGEIVVAAVVPTSGQTPAEESLKAALRDHIASYKIPRRIIVIAEEEIQWTPSNKIKVGEMTKLIAERIGHEEIGPGAA